MNASLQDRRTWLIGGAAAAAVVSAASWFLVISPVVDDTDSLQAQTASVQQQSVDAQKKLRELADSHAQLGGLKAQLVSALEALPMANGLPDFTRQLNRQASSLGLSLDSINVGGFTTAGSGGSAGGTSGGNAGAADPAAGSGTSPTAAAGGGAPAPAAPAAATGGPVAIAVTVTSTGPDRAQLAFIRAIRLNGPRRALVNSVTLSPKGTAGGKSATTMTATLTVFAMPETADARAQILKLLRLK
jgi:hypothetical protein